jgi:hypothetical protein
VIAEPQRNVPSGLSAPGAVLSAPSFARSRMTAGPSPATSTSGASTAALNKLLANANASALPPTTSSAFLMTTECVAVMAELATPNASPAGDTGLPSRSTPTTKPAVTRPQESRTGVLGRAER